MRYENEAAAIKATPNVWQRIDSLKGVASELHTGMQVLNADLTEVEKRLDSVLTPLPPQPASGGPPRDLPASGPLQPPRASSSLDGVLFDVTQSYAVLIGEVERLRSRIGNLLDRVEV